MLLHTCCAPCGTHPIRLLLEKFDVTVFFYNPNIYPESEYAVRLNEMTRLAYKWGVPFLHDAYIADEWFDLVRGHEKDAEGGERCFLCFRLRLDRTAKKAMILNFPFFTTTLTLSPHKNAQCIQKIGFETSKMYDVSFFFADFKKKNGFNIATRLCREEGIYRQNYCGCLFSFNKKSEKHDDSR